MLKPWTVLNSEYLINNKWLKISKKSFLLPDGSQIPDFYIAERSDVVVIIPLTQDHQTLLFTEFERGILDMEYKFPAGHTGVNEEPSEAARREFLEETGMSIGQLTYVGYTYADPGWITTKVHVFLAEILQKETAPDLELGELFEAEWLPFSKVGQMITQGKLHHAYVIATYFMVKEYLMSRNY